MPQQFFDIPKNIVRATASLSGTAADSGAAEVTVIDLEATGFVLQLASVWVKEDDPVEDLTVYMVIRDEADAPVASISIPIFPSARLHADGSGIFIGNVQGPVPVKRGEKLCFQVQWKADTGTFFLNTQVCGFAA